MLKTDTVEKALDLLEEGSTFPSITEQTGITTEDAEAVHIAWFKGTTEQLFRELQLAGVLELAAAKLRSGQGWDEGTTGARAGTAQHDPAHDGRHPRGYRRVPPPLGTPHAGNAASSHGAGLDALRLGFQWG